MFPVSYKRPLSQRPGYFIVRFKENKFLVPKHGILYLGDYPTSYAPDYCSVDYDSDDEFWMSGDSDVDSSDDGVSVRYCY